MIHLPLDGWADEPTPSTPAEGFRRYAWRLYGIAAGYYARALYFLESSGVQAATTDFEEAARLCWEADNLVREARIVEEDSNES